jgi:hypothetical protein
MKKEKIFEIEKVDRSKHWTIAQDEQLINLANQSYGRHNWKEIAAQINYKTPNSCYLRYKTINPHIKKGPWTKEEDECIFKGVELYGKVWKIIARELFINRTSKQIRDRYINYLDPILDKSKFSLDEDLLLIELQKIKGNKWTKLKEHFPRRSIDALKNRFNSALKKNAKLYNVIKYCSQSNVTSDGNGEKKFIKSEFCK